jgi:prepilin-type N-terminal cleavage/methylation domain-containing protein
MRKGLSLVELLIALSVLSLVIALGIIGYRNIRQNADSLAQDKDQKTFLQALEAFRSTGGNIAAISSSTLTSEEKARALLESLKATASSSERNTRGAVGQLLASDTVVVPYSSSDGRSRIVISGNGEAMLASSGPGYIVVSSRSPRATTMAAPSSAVVTVVNSATAPSSTASRYASNNNYLWDEDGSALTDPSAGGTAALTSTTPSVTAVSFSPLLFASSISGGQVSPDGSISFRYEDYAGSSITLFTYRQDLIPVASGDLNLTANLGSATVPGSPATSNVSSGNIVSSGGTPASGYLLIARPDILKPANTWSTSRYALTATAAPTASGTAKGIQGESNMIQLIAVQQPAPQPTASGALVAAGTYKFSQAGDQIVISLLNPSLPLEIDRLELSLDSRVTYNQVISPDRKTLTITRL